MAEQPRKLIGLVFVDVGDALSDAVENAFRSLPRPPAPTQQAEGVAVGLTQSPPSATGGTDG